MSQMKTWEEKKNNKIKFATCMENLRNVAAIIKRRKNLNLHWNVTHNYVIWLFTTLAVKWNVNEYWVSKNN